MSQYLAQEVSLLVHVAPMCGGLDVIVGVHLLSIMLESGGVTLMNPYLI